MEYCYYLKAQPFIREHLKQKQAEKLLNGDKQLNNETKKLI